MLKELHLQQVGPTDRFDVEFAARLNIFTGDNGLGKSFLLDVAWWVLTGNWVEQPAYPRRHTKELPKIISKIDTRNWRLLFHEIDFESYFDFSEQKWQGNWSLDNFSKSVSYTRTRSILGALDSHIRKKKFWVIRGITEMIPFDFPPEPLDFDKKVRQPGNAWLAKNPDPKKGTRDYWSPFKRSLADGFQDLCAYSVMYEPVGTVEHYLSRENYRSLRY
ncbi:MULTISPECIES: AAA family ATPase [Nostocales]|uniref:AAA family ATPase n=2 Tax=Nostocales TaxID=1161 RepID=A0ABW8WDH6_9CYAN|nr:AAA family ATPase [Tolypothrix bouteillei]